jgi:tetratricopeptide (TPR) repeat protein
MFAVHRRFAAACAVLLSAQLAGCAAPAPAPADMSPAQFEQLGMEAEHALAANDTVAAGKRYLRMVTAYPNHAPTLFRLGTVYLRTGQLEAAQRAFQECLRADPRMTKAHANLALAHLHQFRGAAKYAMASEQVSDANKEALRALLHDVDDVLAPLRTQGATP